jgi:large-conductance mechanosensitive channel
MLEEFNKFAMPTNVVDLAIGAITGGLDFSNYYLPLSSLLLRVRGIAKN